MQKFTRALTREIEIGGERLAVTLSAEGVSIRTVGSRRPPHELDWASILCASTGNLPAGESATPEEITAALEALHAGSRAAKPTTQPAVEAKPLLATTDGGVESLLARLDGWLARHRPRYHEGLLPPASDGELDSLSKVLGKPLPAELRQWLGWHNGQNADLIGSFHETFNLMSAAQIAAAWQERQSSPEAGWNTDWIPLLDDYQGDLIVLDPSKHGCAVGEVWRGREGAITAAPTLAAWLQELVVAMEAGKYKEDPERGEFRRS